MKRVCLASVSAVAILMCPSMHVLAQTPSGKIAHVVVIIQENRTPDNLFGADGTLRGAGGALANPANSISCKDGETIPNLPAIPLSTCFDPGHGHDQAWIPIYNSGLNNGLCTVAPTFETGCNYTNATHPQYSYVDNSAGIVTPYFNIAKYYGFANYMFQTNQGPSFPAHQFLFSGTSAPDYVNDNYGLTDCVGTPSGTAYPCWEWFVAENPTIGTGMNAMPQRQTGCVTAPAGEYVYELDPNIGPKNPDVETYGYNPPGSPGAGWPCYSHNSIANVLDTAGVSWRYYSSFSSPANSSIWVAPNALVSVCGPSGGQCLGKDWSNVIAPAVGKYANDYAPILTDINNCNLAGVSFVVPDGTWSDHPDTNGTSSNPNADGGPSWVAAIINAIGGYPTGVNNCGYWANTVVLVTWDDWGGFYDHVNPSSAAGGPGQGYNGQIGNTSGQQYVYGFRVPLLVVSPYSKQGYVSGPASNPSCAPPNSNYYCHDFGSILGFIEKVWNQPDIGGLNYRFADYWAPDGPNVCKSCSYPLADFFNFSGASIPFAPILGAKYPPSCFHNPNQTGCWPGFTPQDPDDDGVNMQ